MCLMKILPSSKLVNLQLPVTSYSSAIQNLLLKYTNADLKISLYVCVHLKTIPENFAFLILRILQLFSREVCETFQK